MITVTGGRDLPGVKHTGTEMDPSSSLQLVIFVMDL
jgi:hypothetical protein